MGNERSRTKPPRYSALRRSADECSVTTGEIEDELARP